MTYADAQPLILSAEDRPDFDVILRFVRRGSRVLDLGCGSGELMLRLRDENDCTVQGVDQHQPSVSACISKGLSVFHGDLHDGLGDLPSNSFDYVILSRTLQQVRTPDVVIREMLRVGPHAIVSFPNFAFWRIRLHLLLTGTLPISPALPYAWYNTPNIRLITIADFTDFCRKQGFTIMDKVALTEKDGLARQIRRNLDWFGEYGIFLLGRAGE